MKSALFLLQPHISNFPSVVSYAIAYPGLNAALSQEKKPTNKQENSAAKSSQRQDQSLSCGQDKTDSSPEDLYRSLLNIILQK